jgi:glycosyltransferase involved in cell wall biosynthesis
MRIALVADQAGRLAPATNGDDPLDVVDPLAHLGELALAMGRAGHEVTVYTGRDSGQRERVEIGAGVVLEQASADAPEPLPVDGQLSWVAKLARELARSFGDHRPDVVHGHCWTSGLAALLATRGTGVPVVCTFHTLGVRRRRFGRRDRDSAARIRLERAIARDVAHVIATSTAQRAELARMGAARAEITVVSHGVDTDLFTPHGTAARRGQAPRLLTIGRLAPPAGFDMMIRALAAVADAELLIAGGPPAADLAADDEAQRLRAIAERVGVADRVHLLGGVPRSQLPGLLRSADIAVSTQWDDTTGLAPLTAMACGVPVVATAVGAIADIVVDDSTGVLLPPGRPERLAAAIRRLITQPFWREAYGAAGVDRVRARYTWDRIAADTLAVYERALAGPVSAGESRQVGPPGELAAARYR